MQKKKKRKTDRTPNGNTESLQDGQEEIIPSSPASVNEINDLIRSIISQGEKTKSGKGVKHRAISIFVCSVQDGPQCIIAEGAVL